MNYNQVTWKPEVISVKFLHFVWFLDNKLWSEQAFKTLKISHSLSFADLRKAVVSFW